MARKTTFALAPAALARFGLTPAELCIAAGVGSSDALDTAAFFRLWDWAEQRLEDPCAGLRLGAEGIEAGYGVAALVALHAPDFGRALQALARYKQLSCPELVEIEIGDHEVHVRYRWLLATGPAPRLLVDMSLAALLQLARHGTGGRVAPLRVELSRRARGQRYLKDHFQCPIRFGQLADGMVFARSSLDEAFPRSDDAPFAALLDGLEARLAAGESLLTEGSRLRTVLARLMSLGETPSLAEAAARMHLSRRSLQRRLREAGTSFQAELAQVRRLVARRLLLETELDPIAIALLLGFAEPNSFARHFRRWERTTPLRWRAMHAASSL